MLARLSGEPCPLFCTEPQKRCKHIGQHPEKNHWQPQEVYEAQAKRKKKMVERTAAVILKV